MKNKLKKYIDGCKKLIDMPYNQLNLSNYKEKLSEAYNIKIRSLSTSSKAPIKLMSGNCAQAGIVYDNEPKKGKIFLVGKGVLFDAGGYDLKPAGRMNDMKCDMSGMAIAFAVASYFKENNVIAFCPVATNFLHNNNITPGDYIKIGKKEVEITNTDAEGRLILAEALSQLPVKKNDIVITIATLTGACAYAIGEKATAFMTPTKEFTHKYKKASKKVGELAWRLPLWDYLQKDFDKKRIINASKKKCGTIMGGMFIKQFIPYPKNWIHLDIAYSAYDNKKNKATGEPIKTLVEFIKGL